MLKWVVACCAFLWPFSVSAAPETFAGLCEPSAGASLDGNHFAVASDETNVLRVYKDGQAKQVGLVDLESFTGFDKSDLEGAAAVGERVYWISSHAYNSEGKDKKKRKVFFATQIVQGGNGPTLKGVGSAFQGLRDPLAKAARAAAGDLNIEGLASTPNGSLLLGLREPLKDGRAIVVPLENPAEIVEAGAQPKFGPVVMLSLEGRGIRSLERVGSGASYLIAAGPVEDGGGDFAIFRWDGGERLEKLAVDLEGTRPEGLFQSPGDGAARIVSDDGDDCAGKDDVPATEAKRSFRSIRLPSSTN